jgi:hypothetical protein
MNKKTVLVCALVAAAWPCFSAAKPAGPGRRLVCEGTMDTGSGMAGSTLGDCSFQADSEPERLVQSVCEQGATCRVEAIGRPGRQGEVAKVLTVRQIAMPKSDKPSYLESVAGRLDGILAPAAAGCDNPQDTPADRVSVLLDGLGGSAIQIHGRYCAITSGSGDPVGDAGFQAVLRGNCAAVGAPDAELRTGRAGEKSEIVVAVQANGPVKIDGEPLVRCPIRQRYVAKWWIEGNHTFRGRYPQ